MGGGGGVNIMLGYNDLERFSCDIFYYSKQKKVPICALGVKL